ncbi:MAG TPA: carboxypeptidase-like regulatory domain-containing protein [Bryobacteraceae bacterium]|nr:carboxypeptidase-like regulatory domain-containing protein [Bryobacteraceae bacterium]
MRCAWLALLLLTRLGTAQSSASCLIRGTVLDSSTGKAVPKARIYAKPADVTKTAILRTTGDDGGFCFDHLPAGQYEVVAQRLGYLNALYGAKPGVEHGMPLSVDGQTELAAVTLKLLRAAAIAGVVLDAGGEPREGVRVELNRKGWDKGWTPDYVSSAETDDRGTFRLPLLPPGTYYVNVTPPGGDSRKYLDAKGQPVRSAEALTYYNGAFAFARATPIPLQEGQEVANLVLTIGEVTPRHFSGRLSSAIAIEDAGKLYLYSDDAPRVEVALGKDGSFSLDGLVPAKYVVRVTGIRVPVNTEVDLTNGDASGMVVEPEPTFEFRLSARVEGESVRSQVQLRARNLEASYERNSRMEPGGGHLFSLLPGTYQVETAPPGHLFVKSIAIDGRPVPDRVLDLRKGQPGVVEVVLSPRVAALDGRLERSTGGMPLLAVTAVVMSEARSRLEAVADFAQADLGGQFKLESLAPGRYRVFAVEGFEESLWGSLELAAALRDKSLAIELHESEKKSLAVPVITFDEWTAALRKAGM